MNSSDYKNRNSVFPSINPALFFPFISRKKDPIVRCGYLYSSGRAALYFGLSALGVGQRTSILAPTFNCGVEIKSILLAGYHVKFYHPTSKLKIDLKHIHELLTPDIRALMVVHYFGFPQPMQEITAFCKENNLLLIEDCAHALYTQSAGKMVGTFGDIAVFSLRKTLALPNGGCLLINNKEICKPASGKKYESFTLVKSTVRSCLEYLGMRSSTIGMLSRKVIEKWNVSQSSSYVKKSLEEYSHCKSKITCDDPRYHYKNTISILSKQMLEKEDYTQIVRRRRYNYKTIVEGIVETESCTVFFDSLPKGTCPLCCVLRLKEQRDHFSHLLKQRGIIPYVFGRHPFAGEYGDYPTNQKQRNICFWSEQLLGIPIHQQLSKNNLDEIINIVNRSIGELKDKSQSVKVC